jgi:hypothetical protein
VSHHIHTNDETLDEDVCRCAGVHTTRLLRSEPSSSGRAYQKAAALANMLTGRCCCTSFVGLPPCTRCSMYPLLRFDTRLPRRPWHAWQHVYIWVAYPFMHAAFQLGDLGSLARGATPGAALTGASTAGECQHCLGGVRAHCRGPADACWRC